MTAKSQTKHKRIGQLVELLAMRNFPSLDAAVDESRAAVSASIRADLMKLKHYKPVVAVLPDDARFKMGYGEREAKVKVHGMEIEFRFDPSAKTLRLEEDREYVERGARVAEGYGTIASKRAGIRKAFVGDPELAERAFRLVDELAEKIATTPTEPSKTKKTKRR